jgi:hypothetical protein
MPVHRLRPATKPSLGLLGRLTPTQTGLSAGSVAVNVALASNGATATASETYSGGAPFTNLVASNVINGDSIGIVAGAYNWWNGTGAHAGSAVTVNFSGVKTINRIVVVSLQDNYTAPIDPTSTTTFGALGLTGFTLKYWDGVGFAPLAVVTGNNLVRRTVTFPAISTSKILVICDSSPDGWMRIVEIEAWTPGSANSAPSVAITSNFSGGQTLGSDAVVTITASDADGTIASIAVYDNGVLLPGNATLVSGTTASGIWRYTHTTPAVGTHTYTAKATDDDGAQTTSDAVSLRVTQPVVALTGDRIQISSFSLDMPTSVWADSSIRVPWVNAFGDYLDADLVQNGSNHWASYTGVGVAHAAMDIPSGLVNKLLDDNTGLYVTSNSSGAEINSSRFGSGPPTLLVVMDDASVIACPVAANVNNLGGNCDFYLASNGLSQVSGVLVTPSFIRFDMTAVQAAIDAGAAVDTGHQLLFTVARDFGFLTTWYADYLDTPVIPWDPKTIGTPVAGLRDSMSEAAFSVHADTTFYGPQTRARYITDTINGAFDLNALEPSGMRSFVTWPELNNLPAMKCGGLDVVTDVTILKAFHVCADIADQTPIWSGVTIKFRKNIQDGLREFGGAKMCGLRGAPAGLEGHSGMELLWHTTRQSRTNPYYLGIGTHFYYEDHPVNGISAEGEEADPMMVVRMGDGDGYAYTFVVECILNTFTGGVANADGEIRIWAGLPDTGGLVKIKEKTGKRIIGPNTYAGTGNMTTTGVKIAPELFIFTGGTQFPPNPRIDYEVAASTLTKSNPGALKKPAPTWRQGLTVGQWSAISGTNGNTIFADAQRGYSGTANDNGPTTAQMIDVGMGGHAEAGSSDANIVARIDLMQNAPAWVQDIAATSAPGTQFNAGPPHGYYLDGPGGTQGTPIATHTYNESHYIGTLPDGTVKNLAVRLRSINGQGGSGSAVPGGTPDNYSTYETNAVDYSSGTPAWRAAHSMALQPANPFGIPITFVSAEAPMACKHPVTQDIYCWWDRDCWIWKPSDEDWHFWFVPSSSFANGFVGSLIDVKRNRYVSGIEVHPSSVSLIFVDLNTAAATRVPVVGMTGLIATHQLLTMSALIHDRKHDKYYWFCRPPSGDPNPPTMIKIDPDTMVGAFVDTTGLPYPGSGPCNRVDWFEALDAIVYMGGSGPLWVYPTGEL